MGMPSGALLAPLLSPWRFSPAPLVRIPMNSAIDSSSIAGVSDPNPPPFPIRLRHPISRAHDRTGSRSCQAPRMPAFRPRCSQSTHAQSTSAMCRVAGCRVAVSYGSSRPSADGGGRQLPASHQRRRICPPRLQLERRPADSEPRWRAELYTTPSGDCQPCCKVSTCLSSI